MAEHHGKHGSKHHMHQHSKGKDSLAHESKETHANPHGPMPSIAHGYVTGEEYTGGDHHDKEHGECNEKHC